MSDMIKNNIAYVIQAISDICGEYPGKKSLQKLVFLIEQKGVQLNFEYGLHFYGPYSASLDSETMMLNEEGILAFHYRGKFHRMSIEYDGSVHSELSSEQENIIREVINRFKDRSPSELELLTTAIYAYNNLEDKSKQKIIEGVQKIKGSKYTTQEIIKVIEDFSFFDKMIV